MLNKTTILFLIFYNLSWSMVTIGTTPGNGVCTYSTIQDALNSGDSVIRIVNNQQFIENNETTNISGGIVINIDPVFVDVPNDDYHLSANSNAIDRCLIVRGTTLKDSDNNPRG
jgi:hypothetical protein